ncbi:hypothetical protein Echvi_2359 [Echinicola vietnamensis DSM 17526]|uniref:Uncharacterized protein n=1 Tax=Echinicola vietnamensis (strain DSM 17526 / LMG 23754 / KMM 6221) TaxID=926556 RepID=L0FZ90_ECHVK|nr:hypothetical protein Echvi_2359 [Echinicola vietnamensis DSM 17526]
MLIGYARYERLSGYLNRKLQAAFLNHGNNIMIFSWFFDFLRWLFL